MSNNTYNIFNNFPPERFNLLIPVQTLQEINPIYKIVINTVNISTDVNDKEIYRESKAPGDNMYALTHLALLKLSKAANGQVIDIKTVRPKVCEKCIDIVKATQQAPACGSCPCANNVAVEVTMKFPELSGGWRIQKATREIDFSSISGQKEGQLAKVKEFAKEHAESKAMSRCIRKGLHVKSAYSFEELEKPFVVAYLVLNATDPDVKKALIAGSVASSNMLYGSGLTIAPPEERQMLESGTVHTNPEHEVEGDYEVEHAEDTEAMNQGAGTPPWTKTQGDKTKEQQGEKHYCSNPQCKAEINEKVAKSSKQEHGYELCFKCQQIAKAAKGGKQ